MTYIRPFTFEFNLETPNTCVKSFNFFTERDIDTNEFASILDFLGHYSRELTKESALVHKKIEMLSELIIDSLHSYPESCSIFLMDKYVCNEHHDYNPIFPDILNDDEYLKFSSEKMFCHASLYKQKILIDQIISYKLYQKADEYLFLFSELLQRFLGYITWIEKINVRFERNKPMETHNLLNDIVKKTNEFNKLFICDDPIKQKHLETLKKYLDRNIIQNIENKNYLNLLDNNVMKIEKNLYKLFDFSNELLFC